MADPNYCEFCGGQDGTHSPFCPGVLNAEPREGIVADAGDPQFVRARISKAKRRDSQHQTVIRQIMSSDTGRSWMHDLLARCHIFQNPFDPNALKMSFACGEMNVGQQLVLVVSVTCPEQYLLMLKEAADE